MYEEIVQEKIQSPISILRWNFLLIIYHAIYSGDPERLSDIIVYLNQKAVCVGDCDLQFRSCRCEECDDCGFNRCLCNLGFTKNQYYHALNTGNINFLFNVKKQVSKRGWQIADEILEGSQLKKLTHEIVRLNTQFYNLRTPTEKTLRKS